MNRRGFIQLLGGAAAVPLVSVPLIDLGRRIFLPPRGGWVNSTPASFDASLEEFRRRYLLPAMRDLARQIDTQLVVFGDVAVEHDIPALATTAPPFLLTLCYTVPR